MKWWQHFKSLFTPEECNEIIKYALQFPAQEGKIGHGGVTKSHDMRKSSIRWLDRNDVNLQFLFDRLILRCLQANDLGFKLRLSNYPMLKFGHAQFTEYDAANGGEYQMHEDNCWHGASEEDRKISCVVQLSPSADYEGGKLLLEHDPLPTGSFDQQGDTLFFPSHLRHGVTPVTHGRRYSLVIWFMGPRLS